MQFDVSWCSAPTSCKILCLSCDSRKRLKWWSCARKMFNQSINQVINKSNFYIADITGETRLSGTTAASVFNSKIEETVHIYEPSGMPMSWGKVKVKEMCLQMFLEGSNWNGWMDRQRKVVPILIILCEYIVAELYQWLLWRKDSDLHFKILLTCHNCFDF